MTVAVNKAVLDQMTKALSVVRQYHTLLNSDLALARTDKLSGKFALEGHCQELLTYMAQNKESFAACGDDFAVAYNLCRSVSTGLAMGVRVTKSDVREMILKVQELATRLNEAQEEGLEQLRLNAQARNAHRSANQQLRSAKAEGANFAYQLGLARTLIEEAEAEGDGLDDSERLYAYQAALAAESAKPLKHVSSAADTEDLINKLAYIKRDVAPLLDQFPRAATKPYIILPQQPILVGGSPIAVPSSRAIRWCNRHKNVNLGDYWVLRDQIIVGIASRMGDVLSNRDYLKNLRREIEAQVETDYEDDLDAAESSGRAADARLRRLRERMRSETESRYQAALGELERTPDIDNVVDALSVKMKVRLLRMDTFQRIRGVPYNLYWVVPESDYRQNIGELFSSVTGWSFLYD